MTKLATFIDDAEADVLTGVLTGGFRNRPNSTTRRSSRRHERGGNPVNGPAQTAHISGTTSLRSLVNMGGRQSESSSCTVGQDEHSTGVERGEKLDDTVHLIVMFPVRKTQEFVFERLKP